MSKHDKIIDQLFTLARDREPVGNARIAAAIFYKGKIISYGFNQTRTSWMQRRFKRNPQSFFLHAEVDAVRNALKIVDESILTKSTLYIARAKYLHRGGPFGYGLAKPCKGCQDCIDWFNIKQVIYSCDNGDIEEWK